MCLNAYKCDQNEPPPSNEFKECLILAVQMKKGYQVIFIPFHIYYTPTVSDVFLFERSEPFSTTLDVVDLYFL